LFLWSDYSLYQFQIDMPGLMIDNSWAQQPFLLVACFSLSNSIGKPPIFRWPHFHSVSRGCSWAQYIIFPSLGWVHPFQRLPLSLQSVSSTKTGSSRLVHRFRYLLIRASSIYERSMVCPSHLTRILPSIFAPEDFAQGDKSLFSDQVCTESPFMSR
jgi:hypothetical protein